MSGNSGFACSWRAKQLIESFKGDIAAGNRILDIGCGNGAIGTAVARAFGASVEGADISNLLTSDMPFHKLPESWPTWPDKSFDVVMINDALHHMTPEIQSATVKDSLRVGKKVLIFDTRPTLIAKIADVVMGNLVYWGKEVIPLTHKNPEDWQPLFETLGAYAIQRVVSKPFFLYPLKHYVLVASA